MQITQCLRCKKDSIVNEYGTSTDQHCLVLAKCTNYDCSGEQRHKFTMDENNCSACGSENVQPISSYVFLPYEDDEQLQMSQKVICGDCGEKWVSTYTQTSITLC